MSDMKRNVLKTTMNINVRENYNKRKGTFNNIKEEFSRRWMQTDEKQVEIVPPPFSGGWW